jgi:NAD(P)-dependent dehydrogenase (short-subunit alcohol dehydrogenase family)
VSEPTPKVALITGGARGQGAAHANTLARAGIRVIIADVRDEDGARTASDLTRNGLPARASTSTSLTSPPGPQLSPRSKIKKGGWTSWSTTPASSGSPAWLTST